MNPAVFNYTDVLIKKVFDLQTTEKEEKYFEIMSLICENPVFSLKQYGIENQGNLSIKLEDLFSIVDHVVPYTFTCGSFAEWQGENGKELLGRTISNGGFSFTFNRLDDSELFNYPVDVPIRQFKSAPKTYSWSVDKGYSKEGGQDTFPRRTFVSGQNGGLFFAGATFDNDTKYSCNAPLSGYRVAFHHPCELPDWDKQIRLPLDQAVFVAIKPRMITISGELKSYKAKDRECYLADEMKLRFFKTYTQQNCLQECFLNITLNMCNCLPFHMLVYGGLPICGPGRVSCIKNAKDEYTFNESQRCNCLPSCTSLEYDVEISQTDCDLNSILLLASKLKHRNISLEIDFRSIHFSVLAVYFKEMQFLTSERNELYGYVDFFSNVGGLLGLFIGFSATSVIEILYFLTLRLRCNIRMYGKRFWSGSSALIEYYNNAK